MSPGSTFDHSIRACLKAAFVNDLGLSPSGTHNDKGELEGVFMGKPVLLPRFQQPTRGILEDMLSRSDFNAGFDKPALTLPGSVALSSITF